MAESDAGLLLYCITGASSTSPVEGTGVRGGGLRNIVHGGLAAVVSPLEEREWVATPTTAELLEYERIIHSWHAIADVLPMRFGSVLPDEAAVRAHLDEHRATYPRALERVSGCVEMGVRALLPTPPPPSAPVEPVKPMSRSGASYLEALRHRYSAENRLKDDCAALERAVLTKVAPLCREHRAELSRPRPGEPALCSLYFLVPRDRVPAFRAALSPDSGELPAKLALSGPWPPFNFVA
ncbi:GvpL/GvpF family gas vesicle protein [Archangium violaceum]|uniref:GvpL/GvpF family gas vesicle protein n=1 Tax=Archangium violaceum TaxID=83451 RepID=UPI0019504544|nr:GvpL/GvpF family gas vesicle protein [Archangium violaceum]QRN94916.1 GvpL/GvpF family gas vesicle protein [Archangium violaceum]